jgi:hypothetical protein
MTRADRLNAITARVGPTAKYVIHDEGGQRRKIVITNPDTGDAVGAVGDTMDAALAALDAKVPGARES